MGTPPFCPNRHCPAHWPDSPAAAASFCCRDGWYHCRRSGRVRRFRCRRCGQRFSENTFSIDYFAKRRVSYHRLLGLVVNGAGVRATARQLHTSPAAVTTRLLRLARGALSVHAALLDEITPAEHLLADGLESFWVSQYYPTNVNVLLGTDSQFAYALTAATLRRSGRMTRRQRARRCELERRDRADPTELARRMAELFAAAGRLWQRMPPPQRVLRSDEHRLYPRALAAAGPLGVRHQRTPSTAARTMGNPLFAANYFDREIRKDLAEHRRETTCFARSAPISLARMWVYLVYHNTKKPYRVGRPAYRGTHAERAGVAPQRLRRLLKGWLTRRVFLSHCALSQPMLRAWVCGEHTPLSHDRTNRRLTPRYCFA